LRNAFAILERLQDLSKGEPFARNASAEPSPASIFEARLICTEADFLWDEFCAIHRRVVGMAKSEEE
jgi:hypothetical protein